MTAGSDTAGYAYSTWKLCCCEPPPPESKPGSIRQSSQPPIPVLPSPTTPSGQTPGRAGVTSGGAREGGSARAPYTGGGPREWYRCNPQTGRCDSLGKSPSSPGPGATTDLQKCEEACQKTPEPPITNGVRCEDGECRPCGDGFLAGPSQYTGCIYSTVQECRSAGCGTQPTDPGSSGAGGWPRWHGCSEPGVWRPAVGGGWECDCGEVAFAKPKCGVDVTEFLARRLPVLGEEAYSLTLKAFLERYGPVAVAGLGAAGLRGPQASWLADRLLGSGELNLKPVAQANAETSSRRISRCGSCRNGQAPTLQLCGKCVDYSVPGNIAFGYLASVFLSDSQLYGVSNIDNYVTSFISNLVEYGEFGGRPDGPDDKAAIAVGKWLQQWRRGFHGEKSVSFAEALCVGLKVAARTGKIPTLDCATCETAYAGGG